MVLLTLFRCVSLQRISSRYTWTYRNLARAEGQCCIQAAAKCGLSHWTSGKLCRCSYYHKLSPHCQTLKGEEHKCIFLYSSRCYEACVWFPDYTMLCVICVRVSCVEAISTETLSRFLKNLHILFHWGTSHSSFLFIADYGNNIYIVLLFWRWFVSIFIDNFGELPSSIK
jgi:hypothetical protein